jgi:hypothetical protein
MPISFDRAVLGGDTQLFSHSILLILFDVSCPPSGEDITSASSRRQASTPGA